MQFYLATMQSSNGYPWQRFEKAFIRGLASVQVSRLNLYSQLITPRLLTTKTIFFFSVSERHRWAVVGYL